MYHMMFHPQFLDGFGGLWRPYIDQICQDAPHGCAILFKTFRMLRMGAQFIEILFRMLRTGAKFLFKIFRTLRTGVRFWILNEKTAKFPGCSAPERNFLLNFQDAPHGSATLKS